jgi:heme exporter protein B
MAEEASRLPARTAAAQPQASASPTFLRGMAAVLWKDIAAELRSRELLGAMLVFALLVILIFNFALELNLRRQSSITAGVLWVTFAFAGTLGLSRSLAMEKDRGCLDGLLLAPVDRSALFFGKTLGNLVFMLLVEAIVLPIYGALYNVDVLMTGLLGVILLGSLGYVLVGTLLSAMAVQARTREVLLPILLFPVVLPVIIACLRATSGVLEGLERPEIWPWINLLMVYDVIFAVVGWMAFEYVVEE